MKPDTQRNSIFVLYLVMMHYIKKMIALLVLSTVTVAAKAQDMRLVRQQITTLSAAPMAGRGYVGTGREKAARFILRQFSELGLNSFYDDDHAFQIYNFPVNTFPADMYLKWGRKELEPGIDYLVDAGSVSFHSEDKEKMEPVDLKKVKTKEDWDKLRAGFRPGDIYQLRHLDTLCRRLGMKQRDVVAALPKACYVIPQSNKLIWTVATDTIAATVFYVSDTAVPRGKKVTVAVRNKFDMRAQHKNVIAYVPGTEIKDSFIVFTAHYDHLGKMGRKALFPGASDNASGTAFMLAMARYFKANPQRYPIAFIAFSGEEAGLMGSRYYTEHPAFPLGQIKMLLNIDLMGDATDGITVVNAVAQSEAFALLTRLNQEHHYLPAVLSRDNAPNSDHYPFTKVGVPAIFIYANGGKGYYHDVFDKAKELSLRNVSQVAQLLIAFTQTISKAK